MSVRIFADDTVVFSEAVLLVASLMQRKSISMILICNAAFKCMLNSGKRYLQKTYKLILKLSRQQYPYAFLIIAVVGNETLGNSNIM
jgi:hypothetical protein